MYQSLETLFCRSLILSRSPKRFAIVFQKFPAFPNFYVIRPCHNSMKMPSLGMFAFSCAHFCNEILFEGIIRSFLAYFRSGCKFLGQKFIQETNSTFVNQCHFLIWHHLTIVYGHNNSIGLSGYYLSTERAFITVPS